MPPDRVGVLHRFPQGARSGGWVGGVEMLLVLLALHCEVPWDLP